MSAQRVRHVEARIQRAVAALVRSPSVDARYMRALRGALRGWPMGTPGKMPAETRARYAAGLEPHEIDEMEEVVCRWLPLLASGRIPRRLLVDGDGTMAVHWVRVPSDAARIVFMRALGRSLRQIAGGRERPAYGCGGNSPAQISRVHRACLRWLAERVMLTTTN